MVNLPIFSTSSPCKCFLSSSPSTSTTNELDLPCSSNANSCSNFNKLNSVQDLNSICTCTVKYPQPRRDKMKGN